MRLSLCLLVLFHLSGAARASVLSGSGQGKVVEGVTSSPEASLSVAGRKAGLHLVGAGLRYKKVAFLKVKVYVGELFAEAPDKLEKSADTALGSLAAEKAVAIRMTFLRDVDGEKVSNGFREALEGNKVQLDAAPIKAFLEAVKAGGEARKKTTLIVAGEKLPGGKEAVTFESSSGGAVTVSGEAGLVRDIFSIWLGKIDDSGLENLKDEMLGLQP